MQAERFEAERMSRFESSNRRRRNDRGQTLLEFALMLPVLMLLGAGVVDIGRAIFYTIAVNNAATAGAQFGAQSELNMSPDGLTKMQTVATQDARFTSMSATANYGCACDNGNGSAAESCTYPVPPASACSTILSTCATGTIVRCVQVTTTATFPPILTHFPGLPASYTANGQAVMRVRQ
jgi:Flp pilus assembly protein TadG